MIKVSELPNHYSNLDDLTLYRWDKYVQTKDNNWFLKNYDGRQKKIVLEQLTNIENNIVDEYFKAIDDRSFSLKLQKWGKINNLRTKFVVVSSLLDRMFAGFGDAQMDSRYLIISFNAFICTPSIFALQFVCFKIKLL